MSESLGLDEREALIYEMCTSHIGADGMRALKGKSASNIIIVGIISLIVGAVLMYGILQFMDAQKNQAPATQPTTQQTTPIKEIK